MGWKKRIILFPVKVTYKVGKGTYKVGKGIVRRK